MAVEKKYQNTESEAKSLYILDRAAQGATMQQIADELNLSVAAVNQRYRKEAKSQLGNMANIVAEIKLFQTQQLGYIYNQAVKSWQLSADVDEETGDPTKPGDPKYLDTAMKSMADVRKIWQADKPIEITPDGAAFPVDTTAKALGGNLDRVQDVLLIFQEIGVLPPEVDMEQVGEHLIPVEHEPPLELPEEIL